MEEDMDEGQTQKGKKAFSLHACMNGCRMDRLLSVNLTWVFWHGVSGASADTIAQMLAFPFLNRGAAVCGNSFVHWVSALHWRVHVYMCCLGSQRGVNLSSEGWTVFVCLIRLSCLSWWLRGKHELRNRTKLLHSVIHQLSGSALCVQIPRRCIVQRCFATISVDLMQELLSYI